MRRIGYSRRKENFRREKKVIIIVCEGEKTEINYLRGFNERNCSVTIRPIFSDHTDPKSIVKYAEKELTNYKPVDGHQVWCVYDVDENPTHDLNDAYNFAQNRGIQVALTNPSFELWYLIHFDYRPGPTDRFKVIEDLKVFIPQYEKSKCYNPILFPLSEIAIRNSKLLNQLHERTGNDLNSRNANPSSQVFRLIEAIEILKRQNLS